MLPAEPSAQTNPAVDSMEAAVRSLGTKQRELLDLAMERPRTYEELARLTHLSVAAVRNRLFRARERLRKLLRHGKDRRLTPDESGGHLFPRRLCQECHPSRTGARVGGNGPLG